MDLRDVSSAGGRAGARARPGPGTGSPFETAWHEFRRRITGPFGCILALLCLPFALLGLFALVIMALWKGRQIRKAVQGQMAAERSTDDAVPTALLVRSLALDDSFTRAEAEQTAVPASAGKSAADLLADAIRRGWVEESGDRLSVTPKGRENAESVLGVRRL